GRKVEQSGNLFVGITTTTTTRRIVRVFNERRVHTVVNARSRTPDAYPDRVPERVAGLLDTIPAEVRPFVTIVDGQVTREEIHRRLTSSKTEVETHSVYRPDPAVGLFNTWAITGWGGSLDEPATSTYQGHMSRRTNGILVASAIATLAAAAATVPFAGPRGAGVVILIGAILTALSQIGMRVDKRR